MLPASSLLAFSKSKGSIDAATTCFILAHLTWSQRVQFLRESLRNLRLTGSVAPSSRYLCRAIVAKIDPGKAHVVVELGPGDGVITRYILERLHTDCKLVIFEINETFVERIVDRFSDHRLIVIHDSAENMGAHFKHLGIESVDYFVSGIPFVMLPESLTESIIQTCRRYLTDSGKFIQFHYSPILLGFYRKLFRKVKVDLVALNLPPALVVSCEK